MATRKATVEQEVGARIRQLRDRKKLSQDELARAIRLSKQCVSKIERTGGTRLETLGKIAAALGVTLRDLVPSSRRPRAA